MDCGPNLICNQGCKKANNPYCRQEPSWWERVTHAFGAAALHGAPIHPKAQASPGAAHVHPANMLLLCW
jgi:hypothetical protein